MNKRIRNRSIVILAVVILSVYLFTGFKFSGAGLKERLRLGLDLQGGTQLVLEVQTDDALRLVTDQTIDSLQAQLQKDGITVRQMARPQVTYANGKTGPAVDRFSAVGVDPTKDGEFRNLISGVYPDWEITSTAGEVPNTYVLQLNARAAEAYRVQAVDQALTTIDKRVNALGVAEPVIQKRGGPGEHEILVQFPGVDDPNEVKKIIGKPALLELKLVQGGTSFTSRESAAQQVAGNPNLQVLESQERGVDGGRVFYVVSQRSQVTGRDLKNASVSRDDNGRPAVSFALNADGAAKFGKLTEENIGKQLAIVLDGAVVSAPTINGRITDSGIITGGAGGFAPEEAKELALVLKSGALPASMTYLEETVVGATLGEDSIRNGILASVIALSAVVIFVLFYYRASGVNATIAMVLNLVVLFGAMAYFGSTLTLPGIAGVILTIGVGIDSNVLIFERIREELRAGKTAVSAVTTSFQRVFITLVDTHLAALISATFLFLFGTSAIRGFAVTLVIGLVANMFTAVFVSRTLFEIVLARKTRDEAISI